MIVPLTARAGAAIRLELWARGDARQWRAEYSLAGCTGCSHLHDTAAEAIALAWSNWARCGGLATTR